MNASFRIIFSLNDCSIRMLLLRSCLEICSFWLKMSQLEIVDVVIDLALFLLNLSFISLFMKHLDKKYLAGFWVTQIWIVHRVISNPRSN